MLHMLTEKLFKKLFSLLLLTHTFVTDNIAISTPIKRFNGLNTLPAPITCSFTSHIFKNTPPCTFLYKHMYLHRFSPRAHGRLCVNIYNILLEIHACSNPSHVFSKQDERILKSSREAV